MDLDTLRKEHGSKTALLRAMVTIADEEKRQFTADEEARWEALQAQVTDLDRQIKRAAFLEGAEGVAHTPMVAVERPGVGGGVPTAKTFRSLGEFYQAVYRAAVRPSQIDERLQQRSTLGANEGQSSEGGFLVDQDKSVDLGLRILNQSAVASRCREITVSGSANGTKIYGVDESSRAAGSRWGGVRAYWAGEGESVTASQPKFAVVDLSLKKLFATCYATDEVLADASQLEQVITAAATAELAFKLDDAIINGSGAGMPLGILGADCLVSVAKETGQVAATLQPENIIKMWSRCYGPSRLNAVWYINQDIEPQLFTLGIQVGTGGSTVYMPPGGLSSQPYGTLFGRPVIPIEFAATLGTVGDIILADMSQYALARKGGVQSAMSIHVQFLTDQSVFRFILRVDGRPLWPAKLTPYKGTSNTVSPFVALATRA